MSKHYRAWLIGSAAAGVAAAGTAAAGLAPVALADKKDDNFFDPEALERGAKALREINKSPYAKQVRSWNACHAHTASLAVPVTHTLW
jgi:ATPase family AAA domain-containing protein 3A/B